MNSNISAASRSSYPAKSERRDLSRTETVKIVRHSLKKTFPVIKFAVRSNTYAAPGEVRGCPARRNCGIVGTSLTAGIRLIIALSRGGPGPFEIIARLSTSNSPARIGMCREGIHATVCLLLCSGVPV
ncbi:LPD29 domain-containing protein [Paraburkholderia fungorum]|uniref:LPD29 domain-containing protein n=1 Tax=Paraburkholderia fungorum TaxID=134537 RepID=UPI000FDAC085|nr:LPD29 domain-containing protein [Paraburkholderia fungorum]